MTRKLRTALVRLLTRRPYYHLPGYMDRYWLLGGSYRDDRPETERGWKRSRLDWWIGQYVAVRLHRIRRSDGDRHLHDHPFANISIVLAGGYWELVPERQEQHPSLDGTHCRFLRRRPGSIVVRRRASDRHKIFVRAGGHCWSVFMLGPRRQEWGFYTPRGKVPWRTYLGLTKETAQ